MRDKVKDPDTYRKDGETVSQHALRLLETVPHDEWLIGKFTNNTDKCCGLGHYMRLTSSDTSDYSSDNCNDHGDFEQQLRNKSIGFFSDHGVDSMVDISFVNNFPSGKYNQATPKDRVIALLKDMVAAGY